MEQQITSMQLESQEQATRIDSLEKEITLLTQNSSSTMREIEQLQEQRNQSILENNDLHEQIRHMSAEKTHLFQRTRELQTQNESLQAAINSLADEYKGLLRKVQEGDSERQGLEVAVKDLDQQLSARSHSESVAKTSVDNIKSELSILKQKEALLMREGQELRQEISRRDEEFVCIQGEFEEVSRLFEVTEKALKDKDKQITQIMKENHDLHEQVLKMHSEIEENEREIRILRARARGEGISPDTENQQLRSQMQGMFQELAHYKTKSTELIGYESLCQSMEEAKKELERNRQAHRTQESQLLQVARELRETKSAFMDLEREKNGLYFTLQEYKSKGGSTAEASLQEVEGLKMLASQLDSTVKITQQEIRLEKEEVEKSRQRLAQSEDTVERLAQELAKKKDEADQYRWEVNDLKKTAEDLVDDFKASEEESTYLRQQTEELAQLQQDYNNLKKKHEEDRRDLKKRVEHNKKLADAYEKQRLEFQQTLETLKQTVAELNYQREDYYKIKEKAQLLEMDLARLSRPIPGAHYNTSGRDSPSQRVLSTSDR